MTESKDIKETKELLKAIELLSIAGAKIAKDKKVSAEDLPAVLSLASDLDEIVAGFKGVGEIEKEIKDLDKEELITIVESLYVLVKNVKAELDA